MKNLFKIFFICLVISIFPVNSFSLEDTVKDLSNEVVFDAFADMRQNRENYAELKDLPEDALKKNNYGIYIFEYSFTPEEGDFTLKANTFGLTILPINERRLFNGKGSFQYGFPLLGIKFNGYQSSLPTRRQFNMQDILRRHSKKLLEEQNNRLPLRLTLSTQKDYYEVDEDITFEVVLENVSEKNLRVKDLNYQTLYFLYNNTPWGANKSNEKQIKNVKDIVLEPNSLIRRTFKGSSFPEAKEVQIYCSYALSYQGVKPSNVLHINIVDEIQY